MSHSYKPFWLGTWHRRHSFLINTFIKVNSYIFITMQLVRLEVTTAYFLHNEAGSNTQHHSTTQSDLIICLTA